MAHDQLRLVTKAISIFIPLGIQLLGQYIRSIHHRWTYKVVDDAKNVVVVGGSFAGLEVAKRLAETLPTGFRLVLIEKNSHFNYLFHFPRFSVVQGHERTAFVPFDNLVTKNAPNGIFTQIRSTVTSVSDGLVHLSSGETIDFEVLVLATGALQPPPAKVVSTDREEGCAEFRAVQQQIKESTSIAVIGAGAVGVELASDIKDFYPDKKVALIHSRGQVMNRFPKRLHDAVLPALEELGVRVILNERPVIPGGVMGKNVALTFADGREELFDLVVSGNSDINSLATIKCKFLDPLYRANTKLFYAVLVSSGIYFIYQLPHPSRAYSSGIKSWREEDLLAYLRNRRCCRAWRSHDGSR